MIQIIIKLYFRHSMINYPYTLIYRIDGFMSFPIPCNLLNCEH